MKVLMPLALFKGLLLQIVLKLPLKRPFWDAKNKMKGNVRKLEEIPE